MQALRQALLPHTQAEMLCMRLSKGEDTQRNVEMEDLQQGQKEESEDKAHEEENSAIGTVQEMNILEAF